MRRIAETISLLPMVQRTQFLRLRNKNKPLMHCQQPARAVRNYYLNVTAYECKAFHTHINSTRTHSYTAYIY